MVQLHLYLCAFNVMLWDDLCSNRNYIFYHYLLGRAVALWLRHYATIRLVAGSIPDGVIGIFQ